MINVSCTCYIGRSFCYGKFQFFCLHKSTMWNRSFAIKNKTWTHLFLLITENTRNLWQNCYNGILKTSIYRHSLTYIVVLFFFWKLDHIQILKKPQTPYSKESMLLSLSLTSKCWPIANCLSMLISRTNISSLRPKDLRCAAVVFHYITNSNTFIMNFHVES